MTGIGIALQRLDGAVDGLPHLHPEERVDDRVPVGLALSQTSCFLCRALIARRLAVPRSKPRTAMAIAGP